MSNTLDANLFYLYLSNTVVAFPALKKFVDDIYETQKYRFYEKAKSNPYYNHIYKKYLRCRGCMPAEIYYRNNVTVSAQIGLWRRIDLRTCAISLLHGVVSCGIIEK